MGVVPKVHVRVFTCQARRIPPYPAKVIESLFLSSRRHFLLAREMAKDYLHELAPSIILLGDMKTF